ncbi:MAG: coenzyme F420-0:L-glutamate ligase [Pusillimonas sp.]
MDDSLHSTSRRMTLTALAGVPLVKPGDDLVHLIRSALAASNETLRPGDVLVLAQKIVSKAQNRYVRLRDVTPSERALELATQTSKDPRLVELVLRESNRVLRYARDVLIVEHRLGFVMANAGIDMSNVEQHDGCETALLLPESPDESSQTLWRALSPDARGMLGIIINDSHGRAWRNGTVGVSIGSAGLSALQDRRGDPDLFGRALLVTEVAAADEIAAAASLLMGQADEGSPLVLVRGLAHLGSPGKAADLIRPSTKDLFR